MRRGLSSLCLVPLLACSACVPQGLNFKVDKRVEIGAPRNDAVVSFPFTLRWSVRDFDVVEPGTPVREAAGYFAVFIDSTPMGPGKSLHALREKDATCEGDCTDATYFAERGIYTTTDTRLVVKELPPGDDKKTHRATVVLLNSQGARMGESAWHVNFRVPEQEDQS